MVGAGVGACVSAAVVVGSGVGACVVGACVVGAGVGAWVLGGRVGTGVVIGACVVGGSVGGIVGACVVGGSVAACCAPFIQLSDSATWTPWPAWGHVQFPVHAFFTTHSQRETAYFSRTS